LPEIFTPVDIIEGGTHDATAGRGMNKLIVGVVYPDMQPAFAGAGFEENQIARKQLILINFGADSCLLTSFAW